MNFIETCVVCGKPVPEGRQVCPVCYASIQKEQENKKKTEKKKGRNR